jgi:rhodanese-related sulfurtransferase
MKKTQIKGASMKTLSLISLLFISSFAFASSCNDMSKFGEVSKEELTQLIQKKSVFVVDVNSSESYKKSHVPTAIHYGSNEKNFTEMLPKDKSALIVAYCGGVQCTAWLTAAHAACQAGYTNIKHYKGGISGWNKKD